MMPPFLGGTMTALQPRVALPVKGSRFELQPAESSAGLFKTQRESFAAALAAPVSNLVWSDKEKAFRRFDESMRKLNATQQGIMKMLAAVNGFGAFPQTPVIPPP